MDPTARRPSTSRLRDAVAERVRIDTRTLAVFRVLAGLLILVDLGLRSRNFRFFYTEEGVVPESLARAMAPVDLPSVYYLAAEPAHVAALFLVQAAFAGLLVVGYRTRLAALGSFVMVISLQLHNPLVLSYADVLFAWLLLWALFLPLGERWSVDAVHADREPRASVASLGSAAILLQMVTMYAVNGYHKTASELWLTGEATVLIMGLDHMTFLLGDYARAFPTLLQAGGLVWLVLLLSSPLLVLLRGRARSLLAALFVGGHAGLALSVRIGAFSYVCIAGVLLFVQADAWRDGRRVLDRVARVVGRAGLADGRAGLRGRLRNGARRLERAAESVPYPKTGTGVPERVRADRTRIIVGIGVAAVLLVGGASGLAAAGVVDAEPREGIEAGAAELVAHQTEWSIFAPHPRVSDQYFVFPARTADGDVVDAYSDRELSYDRPDGELQEQYGTYRERFYMNALRGEGGDHGAPALLAEHYCEHWETADGATLTHVNIYHVSEEITRETIDAPGDRARSVSLVHRHGCGDAEPRELAPPDE